MGGDLAVELGRPAAGDLGVASGATAFGRQAVIFDVVAVAGDDGLVATRAARVFPRADLAGKVAGIDVTETGLAAELRTLQQVFDVGVALVFSLHFVVAVEGGDVPG